MIPNDDENTSIPSGKQCSQSKCKTILPPGSTYKTCDKCRNSSKLRKQKKRKRGKEEDEEEGSHRKVCLHATGENGGAGDRTITYIVIDDDDEKSSDEDEVIIHSSDFNKNKTLHSFCREISP